MLERCLQRLPVRVVVTLLVATVLPAACSGPKKNVPALQLEDGRLTVTNNTRDDWTKVEIWVNRQYRLTTESIPAGQQLQTPLSIFVEAYGRRFDFSRQQIKDLRLSARTKAGTPVDVRLDLKGSGLAGLAGVGVFKSEEEPK